MKRNPLVLDVMLAWLKWTLRIVIGAIVVVVALGGYAYASDYPVQATIVQKECGSQFGFGAFCNQDCKVTAQTKLFSLRQTVTIPAAQCSAVQTNNFVIYHVRSGRTSLYATEGGTCIFDSVHGPGGCSA